MDVGVIGAGSIGMLIGSYLAESGISVTMLVRSERQQIVLNQKGICRINENTTQTITPVHATNDYNRLSTMDLIIIAVKYKDLSNVLTRLKEEKIKIPLLFIQNGIGHWYDVMEEDFQEIAFATVEHGALKESMHSVRHNGVGNITIGLTTEEKNSFLLLKCAHQPQFPIRWHRNPEYILLRKVLVNCLINPLTTILNVRNGYLIENRHSKQLMKSLYDELIDAFPQLCDDLSFEAVENICRKTASNHSSMLTDYLHRRPMEIEPIVSALIQRAKENGKSLPLLTTYEQLLFVLDKKAKEER